MVAWVSSNSINFITPPVMSKRGFNKLLSKGGRAEGHAEHLESIGVTETPGMERSAVQLAFNQDHSHFGIQFQSKGLTVSESPRLSTTTRDNQQSPRRPCTKRG